jgi:hypothetical protein
MVLLLPYALRQLQSPEQGGFSHRSSLPQQGVL